MDKIVNSIPEINNVKENSTNLFVKNKRMRTLYTLRYDDVLVREAFSRRSKAKVRVKKGWLDLLTIVIVLIILLYLLVCAVVNVYVLDSIVGI